MPAIANTTTPPTTKVSTKPNMNPNKIENIVFAC